MWTNAALSLTGLLSFFAGFLLCGAVFARGCDSDDEKLKGREYGSLKIVPIASRRYQKTRANLSLTKCMNTSAPKYGAKSAS